MEQFQQEDVIVVAFLLSLDNVLNFTHGRECALVERDTHKEHRRHFAKIDAGEECDDYIILIDISKESRINSMPLHFNLFEDVYLTICFTEIVLNVIVSGRDAEISKGTFECAGLLKKAVCKINCHIIYVLAFPILLFSAASSRADQ